MANQSCVYCIKFRNEPFERSWISTQIGDLASFFLVVGVFTLFGAFFKKKYWFYTPIALLSFAAFSRIIAFLFHDAALSSDKILIELVLAGFLLFLVKQKENSFS